MNLGTLTAILAAVDAISPVVSKISSNVGTGMGKIKGAIAGAFAVDAIVGAIGKFTDFTGKLTDLSHQTGIGTEKLQALENVFRASSIETVTKSIGEMSRRLISGDAAAVNAMGTLGLKTSELLALNPDEAFTRIADAVAGVENPMERITIAQEIFGKGGKELLADLDGQLGVTTQGLIDMGQVISADVIEAGDQFGDSLDTLTFAGMNLLGTVLGPFIPVLTTIAQGLAQVATVTSTVVKWLGGELMGAFARAKEAVFGFLGSIAEGASKVPLLGSAFEGLGKATDWLKAQAANAGQVLKETYAGMRQEVHEKSTPAVEAAARVVGVYGENAKVAAEKTSKLNDVIAGIQWDAYIRGLERTDLREAISATNDEIREQIEAVGSAEDVITIGVLPATENWTRALEQTKPAIAGVAVASSGLGSTLKSNLLGVLQGIPGTLASALQGAGGIGGALKSVVSQVGSKLGGAAGFAIGGPMGQQIGAALGSFAGPIAGKIAGFFGKGEGKAANDLRDQIISQAGGFDALAKKAAEAGTSIDALLKARDTKGVQAAADALNAALGGRADQIALAKAAMEEFGISSEKAGLAFKQAEMDETAKSITEKLEAMMSIGVSTDDIIAGAGDEIGAFIQRAIEMGTTVPKEWEPIVKKMMDAGTLIDANGDKFTDMSQVPFAETLNDKIGAVMDKLAAFLDGINKVPDALARIPRNVDVDLNFRRRGDEGYEVNPPGFATGSGGIRDFGAGTLAVLHGRERVQTEAQMRAEQAGRGGAVVVNVDARGALVGDYASQQQLADLMSRAVVSRLGLQQRLSVAGAR